MLALRETVSFFLVSLKEKQNLLFPEGTYIKCFVIHPKDEQIKVTHKQISVNNTTP